MQIAFVNSEYFNVGGIGTYIKNLSEALATAGNTVHIIQKNKDVWSDSPLIKFHIVERIPHSSKIVRWFSYKYFWEANMHSEYARGVAHIINHLFDKGMIDIAEIPEFYGEGVYLKKYPYVCRLHTSWSFVCKWNNKKINIADRYIKYMENKTVANSMAVSSPSKWLWNLYSFPQKKFKPKVIIPYPIERNVDTESVVLNSSNTNIVKIAYVGRIEKRKGVDVLFKIIPEIIELNSLVNVVIAGEITDEGKVWIDDLNQILRQKKIESRCKILGEVKHEEAEKIILSSDIVCIPSRFDNFPNVVLEAMVYGKCIVASSVGGITEMIDDGQTGLLFDLNKKEYEFKDKLIECISNKSLRNRLGENARKMAEKKYSKKFIVQRTMAFYEEVIKNWKN